MWNKEANTKTKEWCGRKQNQCGIERFKLNAKIISLYGILKTVLLNPWTEFPKTVFLRSWTVSSKSYY